MWTTLKTGALPPRTLVQSTAGSPSIVASVRLTELLPVKSRSKKADNLALPDAIGNRFVGPNVAR